MRELKLTKQELYERLYNEFDYIIDELEKAFLYRNKCSTESELYLNFHDILIDRVSSFMKIYNLPKKCNIFFDPVRGFITQFRKTIYFKGAECDSYSKTNKEYYTSINVEYDSDIQSEKLSSYTDIEKDILDLDLLNNVKKGYKYFLSFLSPFEKIFFSGMYDCNSTESIIRNVGNNGFNPPSTFIAHKKRKELEYRIVCFFAQEKYQTHDESEIIKALNNYPNLNKKAFGDLKIFNIPSQEKLENVISGNFIKKNKKSSHNDLVEMELLVKEYDPKIRILPHGNKTFAKSTLDFNGKNHSHYVVYIDRFLNCYCHVTKKNRNLYKLAS